MDWDAVRAEMDAQLAAAPEGLTIFLNGEDPERDHVVREWAKEHDNVLTHTLRPRGEVKPPWWLDGNGEGEAPAHRV